MAMVLVPLRSFEVRLTIEGEEGRLRNLLSDAVTAATRIGKDGEVKTNMDRDGDGDGLPSLSLQNRRRRDVIQIDLDLLTIILKNYFDSYYFDLYLSSRISSPFSHVTLWYEPRGRRLDATSSNEDGLLLLTEQENLAANTDGVVNNETPLDILHDKDTNKVITLTRVKSGNLRRRLTTYLIAEQYNGVAIFNSNQGGEIPDEEDFWIHQLEGFKDENNQLLDALRHEGDNLSPVGEVIDVSLSALSYEPSDPSYANPNAPINVSGAGVPIAGTNAVIVIAVAVAACSMCLLGFALYLAFRRRQQPDGSGNTELKEISPNRTSATNDISPLTNGTHQRKGHHNNQKTTPPVLEMQVHPHHDDEISEYTESVYSLPVTAGARSNSMSARDLTNRQRQLLRDADAHEKPKVSNRFNPRYIISSKRSSNASDSDNEQSMAEFCGVGRGASQEMEGVPQLTTPMKEVLRQQTQVNQSHGSSDVTPLTGISADIRERAVTAKEPNSSGGKRSKTTKFSPSGLYPADVIDDDINSSLAGYRGETNIGKSFRNYMGDDSIVTNNQNDNDGGSVSSYESYGFSLDGADYSTVANSTRYGY